MPLLIQKALLKDLLPKPLRFPFLRTFRTNWVNKMCKYEAVTRSSYMNSLCSKSKPFT